MHTESLFSKIDSLENELMKACENGRLFKLVVRAEIRKSSL